MAPAFRPSWTTTPMSRLVMRGITGPQAFSCRLAQNVPLLTDLFIPVAVRSDATVVQR